MAKKTLDAGMIEKAELYYTDRPYKDGTPRYAARSNWFIRFWGYVFHKLPESLVPPMPENSAALFVGTDNKLKLKLGNNVTEVGSNNEQIDISSIKLTEIDSGLLSGDIDMAEREDDLDMQNLNIDLSIKAWDI